ncbi:MAG: hypothetical protein Q8N42_02030 [bacterium]|nr:hypothetical protein [bacterium]
MSYEFRVVPHSILPDTQMVEYWRNGKFAAGIYADQCGIRVVSKFMVDVSKEPEPAMARGEWLPSAFIELGEKSVSIVP